MSSQAIPVSSLRGQGGLLRGQRRVTVALVGLPGAGRTTLFRAVASTSVYRGELAGTARGYDECRVQIGADEARVIDLPSVRALRHRDTDDLAALQYLLWGDERPPVSRHEGGRPPAPFAPPDVIVQVADATRLEHHLELTLELLGLGRPLVLALNKMDEAQRSGLDVAADRLAAALAIPVVPLTAAMGQGIAELFAEAVAAVRAGICPLPLAPAAHVAGRLAPLQALLGRADVREAFRMPPHFLAQRLAEGDPYFADELAMHFPALVPEVAQITGPPTAPCRARSPRSCTPNATTAPRCSSSRPCTSARRARRPAGGTGSTSCSCGRAGGSPAASRCSRWCCGSCST